jgi:hypothetical protein
MLAVDVIQSADLNLAQSAQDSTQRNVKVRLYGTDFLL